jgi:phosphoribosylanthranilate isomerase
MVKLKICGLRRNIDIEYVNRHLPDYIGFIFAESKRQVEPEQVKLLTGQLDYRIKKVGVFVNAALDKVLHTVDLCGLDVVQIHGDESPEYIYELKSKLKGTEVWKAIRVKDADSIKTMKAYNADAFVLDAYVDGCYGGAGKTFDWSLAIEAKNYGNIVLAGGLNLKNVREATGLVHPFAVDISSGVETDGFKDEEKIKDFIYSVRRNVY